jgi:glycosyltransferase involved in cell wall biosynthesis
MARRSTVLLVGKGPPELGGIPSFLVGLTDSRLADEFDLRFLNLTPATGSQGGRLTPRNVASTVTDALRVARAARAADLVHLHSALFPSVTLVRAGLLVAAARAAGAIVLVHAHGGRLDQWLTTPARRRLARAALVPATDVVAVSAPNAQRLGEALGREVEVLLNGVDLGRFRPPDEPGPPDAGPSVPSVLYAGVLARRKGLFELFEASRTLHAEGLAHELHLAGGAAADGSDEEGELRAAAPPWTTFLGRLDVDGVAAAHRRADVFCLPSWGDAMPLCVLEAMASGIPVVASDVGQVAAMVEHGATGSLVPPRDPEALAAALRPLLTDPTRRRALGAAARRRAEERFDLRTTVDRIAARYHELLASAAERPSRRRTGHRLSRRRTG